MHYVRLYYQGLSLTHLKIKYIALNFISLKHAIHVLNYNWLEVSYKKVIKSEPGHDKKAIR